MNKLTTAVTALSTMVVGGIVYFLTPNFGIDYTKKPAVSPVSLTERIVLPKSQSSQFTWQNNLDKAFKPNPTLMDYIFPYTFCNQVFYESTINTTSHTRTSNKSELREFLQDQIGKTNQLLKKDIPTPKTFFAPATSCTKPLEQKIISAEVQYQGLASDDNSDRGLDSIFSPDSVNLNTAVKRDKKIAKEIIQLTKNQPDVKIVALKPAESNLTPDDIKLLLKKQYPFGNDFERQEIMAQISMIDRKMLNNSELQDIMALHRGVKVSVLQKIHTEQVVSFPAPLALSPLLLLVPTVRISTFSFIRVIVTSSIYVINTIARFGIFLLSKLMQLLALLLRLVAFLLKKLKQKLTKLLLKALKNSIIVTRKLLRKTAIELSKTPLRLNKFQVVIGKALNTKPLTIVMIMLSPFTIGFNKVNNSTKVLLIKTQSVVHLFIYNGCALISQKPNDEEYQKVFQLPFTPKVQVLIHFKKCDQYNNLTKYVIKPTIQKSSFYETEKIMVQIIKR
jgi:hypothetical protein